MKLSPILSLLLVQSALAWKDPRHLQEDGPCAAEDSVLTDCVTAGVLGADATCATWALVWSDPNAWTFLDTVTTCEEAEHATCDSGVLDCCPDEVAASLQCNAAAETSEFDCTITADCDEHDDEDGHEGHDHDEDDHEGHDHDDESSATAAGISGALAGAVLFAGLL